jgi:RNA polymerase sigma factor (sigma-70 family)
LATASTRPEIRTGFFRFRHACVRRPRVQSCDVTTSWLATILSRCRGLAAEAATAGDGDLLARFLTAKDESAFDLLLARHAGMVWSVCRAHLPKDADAEDAFQATFVALATSGKSIRHADSLGGWLHGTALRIAGKAKRSHVRRQARERKSSRTEAAPAAVADSAWAAWQAAVHDEVHRLPTALREAFVACALEGQRHSDLAERSGVPVGTVAARVSRARQTLLDRLAARGLAPAAAGSAVAFGGVASAVPLATLTAIRTTLTAGPVPATLLTLARFAGDGVTMKTKLLAAAVMLGVAITGGGVARNRADAQSAASPPANAPRTATIPAPTPPVPTSRPAPASFHAVVTSTSFTYMLFDRPETLREFTAALQEHASYGHEYVGTEVFDGVKKMVIKVKVLNTAPAPAANLGTRHRDVADEILPKPVPRPVPTDDVLPLPTASTTFPAPVKDTASPKPTDAPKPMTNPGARAPSPLLKMYEMETTDRIEMPFPESVDAEKVTRAIMAYVQKHEPEFKDFESRLRVTSSQAAGQANRTVVVSGPKPMVQRFKALSAVLLQELTPTK